VVATNAATQAAAGFTWRQVNFNGQIGWCAVDWLQLTTSRPCGNPTPAPAPSFCSIYRANVPGSNLNLRDGPSTTNNVIASIPDGTELRASEDRGAWKKVEFNGNTGFVSTDFVAFVGPCTKLGAYTSCGTPCTQCVLIERPDILFTNDTTEILCVDQDTAVSDYCTSGFTASDCDSVKLGKCASACASSLCPVDCQLLYGDGWTCEATQCVNKSPASILSASILLFSVLAYLVL